MDLVRVVSHIIEPSRLLLRWQAGTRAVPENRTHWIVATLTRDAGSFGEAIKFEYRMDQDLIEPNNLGFQGYPAFRLDTSYEGAVLDVFMKRLPPRSRGDFREYLAFHCLPADANISDFALLGYTGAKLPSDGFSFIHPFDDTNGPCEFRMDVAGWRHYREPLPRMRIDLPVTFKPEPSNAHDPGAIQVISEGEVLGYVPRGLTDSFHRWLGKCDVTAVVHSVPLPEERPDLALFVWVCPRPS